MVSAVDLWRYLKLKGYTYFSGVPCSILKEMLAIAEHDRYIQYVPAVRENVALGIASGAYLAGRKSGILMQNSGLGNIVNALTSFNLIYKIPVLMFISWRGCNGKDAPEHIIMGEAMLSLLKELRIPYKVLSERYREDINWAIAKMADKQIPVALIVNKGRVK